MTSDHIDIPAVSPRVQYVADGAQTDFVYPFPVFGAEDLAVMTGAAVLTGGYTVLGAGDSAGGTVRFLEPPAIGTIVTLRRALAIQRTNRYPPGQRDARRRLQRRVRPPGRRLPRPVGTDRPQPPGAAARPAGVAWCCRSATSGPIAPLVFDADGNVTVASAGTTGSAHYEPTLIGAAARTVEQRLADRLSVKDFGAVGDGLTDEHRGPAGGAGRGPGGPSAARHLPDHGARCASPAARA